MIDGILLGVSEFGSPAIWLGLVAGSLVGYLIGAIPGLGPTLGMALLIPFTFGMDPLVAIITLLALYAAAEYGGAIPSILINAPGTASAVATAWDGYPLTKQGKSGLALCVSIVSSGTGIILSTSFLMLTAVPLANAALHIGPPQNFALALLGLTLVTSLSSTSLSKALFAMFFGLSLTTIGIDSQTAIPRFAIVPEFFDGLPLVPVLLGLYALSEVLYIVEEGIQSKSRGTAKIDTLAVPFRVYRSLGKNIFRSSVIGFFIGLLPGAGASIASFVSYGVAKRRSKNPQDFGKGSLEGISASEAANNAAVSGSMGPLLTLGIPGSSTSAILLGALMIHGFQPGPLLFTRTPEVPYVIIASLFFGAPIMVFIGLAGAKFWMRVADIPRPTIAAIVVGICVVGAYSSMNSIFPVYVMVAFGLIGYLFRKSGIPLAPVVLAVVLGEMLETNFRRAMSISDGHLSIFVESPLTVLLLSIATLAIVFPIVRAVAKRFETRSRNDAT